MAKRRTTIGTRSGGTKPLRRAARPSSVKGPLWRRLRVWALRALAGVAGFYMLLIMAYTVLNPPTTIYIMQEGWRLDVVEREWVSMEYIAPVMARSVVAAEDANFCLHWGFDMAAIRQAVDEGGNRGASTLTQQVVKNVFLWHGRNWSRKAMEAMLTPMVELIWTKRRILEVYLNMVEFGTGIFGVQAAAQHYFDVDAADLSAVQAARLAAVLPDPKGRDAARPGPFVRRKSGLVLDGAATILADGRAACFEQ